MVPFLKLLLRMNEFLWRININIYKMVAAFPTEKKITMQHSVSLLAYNHALESGRLSLSLYGHDQQVLMPSEFVFFYLDLKIVLPITFVVK